MQIIEVDKATYRKRLNIVICGFIGTLLVLSLVLASLIISTLGDYIVTAEDGVTVVNNFRYNLLGVILSVLACSAIWHQLKHKPYFEDIYYVWQVKQLHNKIYRKVKKIRAAANEDNIDAFVILNFYHHTRKQVYLLDDNTLTIPELDKEIKTLDEKILINHVTITLEQFNVKLLDKF